MNILMTGATGFIGSHICRELVRQKHLVYALCRYESNFNKCSDFKEQVIWITQDNKNHLELLIDKKIDLLVHVAWTGISATDRDNWDIQFTNFIYSKQIFEIALNLKIKKIICLGSQAEYGTYTSKVTEEYVPQPTEAYGAIKLLTLYYLQNMAQKYNLEWCWMRIFSVFGENENDSWILPHVMSKLLNNELIKLTLGEQYYDYLFIDDFIKYFSKIINGNNISGIYNICSGKPVKIKQILIQVAEELGKPIALLEFGALPYRQNQNMFMVGSPDKLQAVIGKIELEPLEVSIKKVISFYKQKHQ